MKAIALILLVLPLSSQALEVSEVDCLGQIETLAADFSNDQLDELSQKCDKIADDLFVRSSKKQDKDLLIQSTTARKSATIAKTMRQNNIKAEDSKKAEELNNVRSKTKKN